VNNKTKENDMNKRLLSAVAILAVGGGVSFLLYWVTALRYEDWKCFKVNVSNPPVPHTDKDDEYCVETRNDAWYLNPGTGMSNWKTIGGGSRIPLLITKDTATSKAWKFEVEITGHDNSDHGPQHRAARAYNLEAIIPASGKAEANFKVDGPFGDTIHNGSAHSIEN
jgi:hypothetical protein